MDFKIQGTFPTFERLCRVFEQVMSTDVTVKIVPAKEREVESHEKKNIRN